MNSQKYYIPIFVTIATLFASFKTSELSAQQLSESNHIYSNPFFINSAYAGNNGVQEVYLSHYQQWVGVDDAPITSFISAHSSLGKKKKHGFGVNLMVDKAFQIQRNTFNLAYSYKIKLTRNSKLSFGLAFGIHNINVNTNNAIVEDFEDPFYNRILKGANSLYNDFSIFYSYQNFHIGLSAPNAYENDAKTSALEQADDFITQIRLFNIVVINHFLISKDWTLSPVLTSKLQGADLIQYNVSANLSYRHRFILGLGTVSGIGIKTTAGFGLKQNIRFYYSFLVPSSEFSRLGNGSHEITVGYRALTKQSKRRRKKEPTTFW
jgi:type IX secretion system PorP/SprF family membrane protein